MAPGDAYTLSRRGFVKGAAASGAAVAVPVLTGVAPALGLRSEDPLAHCTPIAAGTLPAAIGVSPDGRHLWVTDSAATTITALSAPGLKRGRSIDVGATPIDIAIAPGGGLALVLTAFYDHPTLAFVNLRSGKVVKRLDVGAEPYALALAPGGTRAFVAGGGEKGTLTTVDVRRRSASKPIAVGSHPLGVAAGRGGATALVALNGAGGVAVVDLQRRRVAKTIATDSFPCRVAISPGGGRALVTHAGLRSKAVSVIDLNRRRVARKLDAGADPFAVAFAGPSTAVVSNYGAGTVSVIDVAAGGKRTVRVGTRPRGLAVSPRGDRAYAVNEFDGSVSQIRLSRSRGTRGGANA
jgi:YVTN family beta-propeller protein